MAGDAHRHRTDCRLLSFNDHSDAAHLIDATGKAHLTASFINDDTDTTKLPADAKTRLAVARVRRLLRRQDSIIVLLNLGSLLLAALR
jgi:hypothetical protein